MTTDTTTPLAGPPVVYSVQQAAELLKCSDKTVRAWLADGRLAGVKPGIDWVIPATALTQRLHELAIATAADLRRGSKRPTPTGVGVGAPEPAAGPARRGRKPRPLPQLVALQ